MFFREIFSLEKHNGTGMSACYANIRKQKKSFSVGETRKRKTAKRFFYGMEAAAQNRR